MFEYRVTKYDPAMRDGQGAYERNEWTSFGDIGRSFDGNALSEQEYLRVEEAYIAAALAFLKESRISSLHVLGLENHLEAVNELSDGDEISLEQFRRAAAGVLREKFWCRFEASDAFVHFGYDYYMYVGVPLPCPDAQRLAVAHGLFVEPFHSPYAEAFGE